MSDGNIRQWQNTPTQLINTYPDVKIIPGHGVVTDKQGLETLQLSSRLRSRVRLDAPYRI